MPELQVLPMQEAGAIDSMHFRGHGILSFGIGLVFIKPGEIFAHGLNGLVPAATIKPGLLWWE